MVRMRGLEPPRREALDPKSSVYTNFTTSACDCKKMYGWYARQDSNLRPLA